MFGLAFFKDCIHKASPEQDSSEGKISRKLLSRRTERAVGIAVKFLPAIYHLRSSIGQKTLCHQERQRIVISATGSRAIYCFFFALFYLFLWGKLQNSGV